jgi:hypothetical protein
MLPSPTRAPAKSTHSFAFALIVFCSGVQLLGGCRIGYEELPLLGGGATSSTTVPVAGTVVGGSSLGQGGDPMDLGGETGSAGGSGSANAGASGAGENSSGGTSTGSGGSTGSSGSTGGSGSTGSGGTAPTSCRTDQYGGHAYEMCDSALSYDAARSDCESRGLRLARIDDDAENTWVHSTIPAADQANNATQIWRWLGADDLAAPGDWRWTDGTLFWTGGNKGMAEAGSYANWVRNQPLNPHCLAMQASDGFWYAMTCSAARPYVCEQY